MAESEEKDLPFDRSSIAAIGARRRWRLFASAPEEDAPGQPPAVSDNGDEPAGDDGPPGRSMLGVFAGRSPSVAEPDAASRFLKEAAAVADEEPPVRSMLGSLADEAAPSAPAAEVREEGPATMLALGDAGERPEAETDAFDHVTLHSTIAELAGLEEHLGSDWPIERGVLISLLFHIMLLLMLLVLPARLPHGSKGDLFAMLEPQPRDDTPIPVILDAPGMPRPNPKPAPLSDADRRAGGGDRSRPKADTPYVPPAPGIAGLAPGPKAPRIAGAPVPQRPGAAASAAGEKGATGQEKLAEKSADAKPSEFPTEVRPQGGGPREIGKLAGLDRAIQEAARGAVAGGEGGAPSPNPDGGFVDSGPLSFDTKWYDWGAYAAEMIRRIKLHWDVPELARLGWKGSLTIRFYIMADGRVGDAKIVRYSGIPPFDNAALQAILKSSPFRPLPEILHEDKEGVTITFFYNMRPESEGGGQ